MIKSCLATPMYVAIKKSYGTNLLEYLIINNLGIKVVSGKTNGLKIGDWKF